MYRDSMYVNYQDFRSEHHEKCILNKFKVAFQSESLDQWMLKCFTRPTIVSDTKMIYNYQFLNEI